ncbi:MAG TPA: LAGLIDADG family homing endonuclease [Candidatus Paceibacterota bacterium]|nr:LAGLIDADG family homing endonuclease [Candidatus Paceibacterota bacterium]
MINLSPELAEICGIHVGDGYLRGKDHRKELDISGNIEEKDYYDRHIIKLFKKVFGIDIKCRFFKSRNTYGFVIRDKEIIKFMHELGFPYGNKSTSVRIPKKILNSQDIDIKRNFLRGLFDTDGCVHFKKRDSKEKYGEFKRTHHYYPIILFTTVSKNLNEDLIKLIIGLGFTRFGNYEYLPKKITEHKKYQLVIYGKDYLNKFFNEVGSKNPVKLSRFLLWKKQGHCPANSTYLERTEILKSPDN